MPNAYTEDQLVEQPAIGLFVELGWTTVSALEETFGAAGTLRRETKGEVVLVSRLRAALVRLNPALPPEAITAAVDELTRDRSAMSLEAANREVYHLLKEGIKVSVPDRDRGGQKAERLRVMDWEHPTNNEFLLVSQFSVTGALYTCRPDLVGFVNGLPLVVLELKKPGVPARAAFDENLTHYKQQIPALFCPRRCSSPSPVPRSLSARNARRMCLAITFPFTISNNRWRTARRCRFSTRTARRSCSW
jgi:type I restriction enzyme R subunit